MKIAPILILSLICFSGLIQKTQAGSLNVMEQVSSFFQSVLYSLFSTDQIYDEAKQMYNTIVDLDTNTIQKYMMDSNLLESALARIVKFTKDDADNVKLTCTKGGKADFYKIAYQTVGIFGRPNDVASKVLDQHDDDCFEQVTATFGVDEQRMEAWVSLTPGNRKATSNQTCIERYLIGSAMTLNILRLDEVGKPAVLTLKNINSNKLDDFKYFGLHVFRSCDEFKNMLPDLLLTAGLFVGGLGLNPKIPIFGSKPTIWQEILNENFIQQGTTYEWKRRRDVHVDLNETEVKSGDFLILTRFDGLDQLIHWGAGSRAGHSVTLLENNGTMWAVESNAAWYWPTINIQKTPWAQWKQWAINAGENVALLPMRDDVRAKFNVTAAWEWFLTVEGYPYGYHNFIFGWFDTPDKSLPPITDIDFLYVIFELVHNFIPAGIDSLVGEALNKRLGTHNLTLQQIAIETGKRNMTLGQLFTIVEQDSWRYSDGPSMVCSAFVAGVYKAGGLFGNLSIQATEFTPRDVYQLNFFDLNYEVPEKCKKAQPGLPYCQLYGKHVMNITDDGYSTYDPYDHMFENCPTEPPLYIKTKGC